MAQKSARWVALLFPLFVAAHVVAQILISAQAFGQIPEAPAEPAPPAVRGGSPDGTAGPDCPGGSAVADSGGPSLGLSMRYSP